MRIGIVGLGLGYSLAKYLASKGHEVTGIDIASNAFESPRLDEQMKEWLKANDAPVSFSTGYSDLERTDLIMIFVSTPLENGRLWIGNIHDAIRSAMRVNPTVEYAILSTLPIGGMKVLHAYFPNLRISYDPPMVKKHRFLSTFIDPPSGWQLFSGMASENLLEFYRSIQSPTVKQIKAADEVVEVAKLCTNLMLATKIIIANSIRDWVGEDVAHEACEIVNKDPRIGEGYFTPDGAAAGPCLPRDLTELQSAVSGPLEELLRILNRINGTEKLL